MNRGNTAKKTAAAVAFAVLVIGAYFLLPRDGEPHSEGSSRVSTPTTSNKLPDGATSAISGATRSVTGAGSLSVGVPRSEPGSDNPYLKEMQSSERKASFDRLAALGNSIAAKTAAELAVACALYGDKTYESTLERIEAGRHPAAIKAQQRAVAARERAKCVGFDLAAFSKADDLSRFAHEKRDPRSLVLELPHKGPIPDRIAAAQDASRLNDPVAIREIGMFFMSRPDVPRSITYDLGDGLGVRSEIVRDAFFLADCGPNNVQLSARCVNAGFCQATSLEESFLRYTYSPADADRLLHAQQVVLTGLQTGRWPANFWDPRAGR
jgi:hypothetical protein